MKTDFKKWLVLNLNPINYFEFNSYIERKGTSRGVAKLIARQKAMSLAAAQAANSNTDDSDSSTSNSPRRTLKQRREDEADRFKTQVIKSPSNILEEEAKAVVEAIAVSKTSARSRSASADGMLDSRILGKNIIRNQIISVSRKF